MQIHLIGIWDRHLITIVSVIERLSLYEFTLWGRDFVSIVCIRESRYYGGYFLKKIYENFVRTLEAVRNREESILERCPNREVWRYSFLPPIIVWKVWIQESFQK